MPLRPRAVEIATIVSSSEKILCSPSRIHQAPRGSFALDRGLSLATAFGDQYLLIKTCLAIPIMLPVSQYSTSPLLCDQNMKTTISGMIDIILAWAGSTLVVGVSFCWTNMAIAISTESTGSQPKT